MSRLGLRLELWTKWRSAPPFTQASMSACSLFFRRIGMSPATV